MSAICGIVADRNSEIDINETQIEKMLGVPNFVFGDNIQVASNTSKNIIIGNKLRYTTPECLYHKIKYEVFNKDYYIAFDGKLNDRDELLYKLGLSLENGFSDSYLIIHSYVKWGEKFLTKLDGEFAFSMWDDINQKLILARDRLGKKNLFYSVNNNILIWGSEIRQIFQHPLFESNNKLNKRFLMNFLIDDPYVTAETAYANISRLEPSQYLVSENGKIQTYKYYQFHPMELNLKSESDYSEKFLELFRNSVKNNLRTNGPIGIALSGGLDSTSIMSLAHHIDPSVEFSAYSLTFKNYARGNEDTYINSILEMYPVKHTFIEADDLWFFKENISNTIGDLDEPFLYFGDANMGEIPNRLREQGIRTYFTGTFGDHVLQDNPRNLALLLKKLEVFKLLKEYKDWIRNGTDFKTIFWDYSVKPLFYNTPAFIPPWLNEEAVKKYYPEIFNETSIYDIYWDKNGVLKHFKKVMLGSRLEWLNQVYNSKGVEGRYSFLDSKLLEFMAGLPNNLKAKPGITKYILRLALKGILPEKIRTRIGKSDHHNLFVKGFKNEWNKLDQYSNFPMLKEMGLINANNDLKKHLEMSYLGLNINNALEIDGVLRALSLEIWLTKKLGHLKGGETNVQKASFCGIR